MIEQRTYYVDNGDGWRLALHRRFVPGRVDPTRRPVVMVPGFAMNAHILGYHPRGPGIAEYIAEAGHEVWCVELRGQGHSVRGPTGDRRYHLADLGLVDLAAAIEGVRRHSAVRADRVDVIGCSLGATFMFMQAAWWPTHRIARMVNIGGPLRWTAVHPALRALAQVPAAWGAVPVRGTRRMAKAVLPVAARWPALLRVYLNPEICDLSRPEQLVATVDDPSPAVNAELARWIRRGDLVIERRNLTEDVARLDLPLLTIVATGDGIVPEATAASAHDAMRAAPRSLIHAGSEQRPMAHADLFISSMAEAAVFRPIVDWLLR
ncbi:MAG: alpha/beta fold hydrolase [Myxococcales bacterium]|nr:alpha/beta fold hydrolase [Myxococcales bacterium]